MSIRSIASKVLPYHLYECIKQIIINQKKIFHALEHIDIRACDAVQKVTSINHYEYEQIIKFYISEKENQKNIDEAYKPGADWEIILNETWSVFREWANKNDIDQCGKFLDNFFRNKIMEGFWGETIDGLHEKRRMINFKGQLVAWLELNQSANNPTDVKKLKFPMVGNPWGFKVNDVMVIEPSMEYEFYAEYIQSLVAGVENPKILEIGGGFGGLAYYLLSKNENINYYATDLTENLILQKYFLTGCFEGKNIKLCQGVADILNGESDLVNGSVKLFPNYLIDRIPDNYFDVIVNFRSFSEMPRVTLEKYLNEASRLSSDLIYHENLYAKRRGVLHGISSDNFPVIKNFTRKYKRFSAWPRYGRNSAYPCAEYLYKKIVK